MSILNRRAFSVGAATAVLAACSSSPVPVDTYYRLEPAALAARRAGAPLKGLAEVMPMRGEGVVNARAILFRRSATELQQYSYHFWADTPASMLQRGLIDAIREAQVFENAALPEMRLNRDYEIVGTLRKLEHDLSQGAPKVVVEVELSARQVKTNTGLLLKVYKAEVPTSGSGVASAIPAFATAFGQICSQFIADLN